MKKLIIGFSLILFSATSNAQVYQCKINGSLVFQDKPCAGSKEQIKQIRDKQKEYKDAIAAREKAQKEYEDRLKVKSTSTNMSFTECKKMALSSQLAVAGNYKTSVIINTSKEYMARICTNDGSVLLTCSARDGKLVTTTSPYCP